MQALAFFYGKGKVPSAPFSGISEDVHLLFAGRSLGLLPDDAMMCALTEQLLSEDIGVPALEQRLTLRSFLCGHKMYLCDVVLAHSLIGADLDRHPHTKRWFDCVIGWKQLERRQRRVICRVDELIGTFDAQSGGGMQSQSIGEANYSAQTERVVQSLRQHGISQECEMVRTEPYYYDRDLKYRASFLGCSESQLCKLLLLHNTKHESPLLAVIAQYECSGIWTTALDQYMRKKLSLSKKKVAYRMVAEGEKISGFQRNGLSPFGLPANLNVQFIVSESINHDDFIWLGGGEIDVKLRVPVPLLIEKLQAVRLPLAKPN